MKRSTAIALLLAFCFVVILSSIRLPGRMASEPNIVASCRVFWEDGTVTEIPEVTVSSVRYQKSPLARLNINWAVTAEAMLPLLDSKGEPISIKLKTSYACEDRKYLPVHIQDGVDLFDYSISVSEKLQVFCVTGLSEQWVEIEYDGGYEPDFTEYAYPSADSPVGTRLIAEIQHPESGYIVVELENRLSWDEK